MSVDELCRHYSRLRADLAQAYGASVWDSSYIDRLTDQIADTETALAARGGSDTFIYASTPGFGTSFASA